MKPDRYFYYEFVRLDGLSADCQRQKLNEKGKDGWRLRGFTSRENEHLAWVEKRIFPPKRS